MQVQLQANPGMLARVCLPLNLDQAAAARGAAEASVVRVWVDGVPWSAEREGDFACVDGIGSGAHTLANAAYRELSL